MRVISLVDLEAHLADALPQRVRRTEQSRRLEMSSPHRRPGRQGTPERHRRAACVSKLGGEGERLMRVTFSLFRLTLRDRHASPRRQRHRQVTPVASGHRLRPLAVAAVTRSPRAQRKLSKHVDVYRRHVGLHHQVLPGRLAGVLCCCDIAGGQGGAASGTWAAPAKNPPSSAADSRTASTMARAALGFTLVAEHHAVAHEAC